MRINHQIFFVCLVLITILSLAFGLFIGSVSLSASDIWLAFSGNRANLPSVLIFELRLPRVMAAFAVGGLLALSGTLLQVLLRNPLADPYILGISGGAAAAALLSMLAGISGIWLTGNAFLGSLLSMVIVFGLAHRHGVWSPMRLLLTGVIIAAGWGAVISFILAISANSNLSQMLYWLMGDLSHPDHYLFGNIILIIGLAMTLPIAQSLNVISRGDKVAATLGINPSYLKNIIYLIASLLTATAVSIAGSIGFVGLIIPHMLRLIAGADHRHMLPNAVLLGGSFLVIADTLARTVMAPTELPVGVITAFIGVPIFLFLLLRNQRP